MTTLGKEVDINEGNFIDSIFDAYFLISKEKAIIVYSPENWYNPNDLSPELPDKLVCHNASIFPIFDSNSFIHSQS